MLWPLGWERLRVGSSGSVVGKLGRLALDLLFPPRCSNCGAAGELLCDACALSLERALPPRCLRCWRPWRDAGPCVSCQIDPPPFDGLYAAFVYAGTARTLVHALKYRGMTALASPMAARLADGVRERGLAADVVVPVPLSGLRRRTRGYNQAEALAREVGRGFSLPMIARALARRRHSPPQARSADIEERRRNVLGAFAPRDARVAGQRVLLLDDVTTTGATLAACAGALKEAGARSVWAVAFARED